MIESSEEMKVNGNDVPVRKGVSLSQFLSDNDYNEKVIVVEKNGEIVQKGEYFNILLKDEDVLEILYFVGGGSVVSSVS